VNAGVSVQRQVDAPPETVFAILADPWSYARWVSGTQQVRAAEPDWPQPGTRLWHWFGRKPAGGPGVTAVLACEPPHRLVLRADVRPLALVQATLSVQRTGTGSLVRIDEDMIGGWARWLGPASALVQRRRNAASLRNLAELTGAPADQPASASTST
jgi:uncharacterized protein YndB with AHSA1/START domain